MIDEKLKSQAEKIIKGVIRWFSENLSVDAGNSKGSVSEEQGIQAEQAAADADENSNPANVDQTVAMLRKIPIMYLLQTYPTKMLKRMLTLFPSRVIPFLWRLISPFHRFRVTKR